MDYYYKDAKGNEIGPVDQDILIGRAQSGEITSVTEVRNSMVKTFKPAQKVACLKDIVQEGDVQSQDKTIAKNIHRSQTSIKAPKMDYRIIAFAMDTVICAILIVGSFNLLKMSGLAETTAMSVFIASIPVIIMLYY